MFLLGIPTIAVNMMTHPWYSPDLAPRELLFSHAFCMNVRHVIKLLDFRKMLINMTKNLFLCHVIFNFYSFFYHIIATTENETL